MISTIVKLFSGGIGNVLCLGVAVAAFFWSYSNTKQVSMIEEKYNALQTRYVLLHDSFVHYQQLTDKYIAERGKAETINAKSKEQLEQLLKDNGELGDIPLPIDIGGLFYDTENDTAK